MRDDTSEFIPYSKRPEFSDIEPIPQYDENIPKLITINYQNEYTDAMNCFRAIVKKNEKSERALELTEYILNFNPAHYYVWKYRQDILIEQNYDIKEELQKMEEITLDTMKSYQIWHHRQVLVEALNDPVDEMNFIKIVLQYDSKNYHAWSYRQWLMTKFNLFNSDELEYIDELLTIDVRNNSAWNQRYFYFSQRPSVLLDNEAEAEIQYAIERIKILPNNKCPWNYIKGIIKLNEMNLLDYPVIEEIATEVNINNNNIFALEILYEISEMKYLKSSNNELYEKLIKMLDDLKNIDFRRENYWNYRLHQIKK